MKRILLAIILAAPTSAALITFYGYLTFGASQETGYYGYNPYLDTILVLTIYQIPFYLILGIPTTLLIDLIIKEGKINKYPYILQFVLYSISAIIVSSTMFTIEYQGWLVFGIAVHTYFHILYFLRRLMKK
ncbi:hypothetical protein [Mesobacillus jeotgali]|uniref:hypothetical protein n=1 Tax=Mesobacillus jeotgali TaxID=129985 RepID=UPI000C83875F|nr:hypothetical protein [Mesobacillus jeotgali]